MKKLFVILLLALFTVGISSCAEEPLDTDPVLPEVSQEAIDRLQDKKTTTGVRANKKRGKMTLIKRG